MDSVLERWKTEAKVLVSDQVMAQYRGAQTTLHHCNTCGFGMFLPALSGTTEFYNEVTGKGYYNPEKWEFWQALADVSEYDAPYLLEIGCGEGWFLDLIRTRLPAVTTYGYDISPQAAKVAQRKGHTVFCGELSDIVRTGELDKTFDVVCLFQLLEHADDPVKLLADLRRLLKPGGKLIIGVPDTEGPIRYFPDALTEIPPHHITRWRASTFRMGMPGLGYHVERIDHEPLPDYLWHAYLPVMWHEEIWPAQLSHRFLSHPGGDEVNPAVLRFINYMQDHKVRWLFDVPGHSLYVVLRTESLSARPTASRQNHEGQSEKDKKWTAQYVFNVLTGLVPMPSSCVDEAWFRQIKAATIFLASQGREAAIIEREAAVNNRESELAEREQRFESRLLVRVIRKVTFLFRNWL